ncbi:MAG: hypothetical protein FWC51_03840 [Proteobacteria bacterium]|nr:hypothetical protein [Pseudomonadota bacterium]
MENSENITDTPKTKTLSVELSAEQYAFLTEWQKTHEQELGIDVPIGAMVRKAVDIAMKSHNKKEERPPYAKAMGGKPPFARDSGGKPGFKSDRPGFRSDRPDFKSDRPRFKSGGGKPFGARTGGGAKFDMLGKNNKTRKFDK